MFVSWENLRWMKKKIESHCCLTFSASSPFRWFSCAVADVRFKNLAIILSFSLNYLVSKEVVSLRTIFFFFFFFCFDWSFIVLYLCFRVKGVWILRFWLDLAREHGVVIIGVDFSDSRRRLWSTFAATVEEDHAADFDLSQKREIKSE